MFQPQRMDFTGITTTGVPVTSGGKQILALDAARTCAIQVKGVGGVPTSWSVTLEGSLDGANWTTLITHTTPDGSTQWVVDKPVSHVRANVGALTLGPASAINVSVLACP